MVLCVLHISNILSSTFKHCIIGWLTHNLFFCFVCSVLHVCHLQTTSLQCSYSTACHIVTLLLDIVISVWIQVRWLVDNYEFAEGMTLPRFSMYSSYVRHRIETGIPSVSVTSFGKLLHSLFHGLGTKRLGKG
jgi:hypothetical protein